jgi:hypothetical protein
VIWCFKGFLQEAFDFVRIDQGIWAVHFPEIGSGICATIAVRWIAVGFRSFFTEMAAENKN